MTIYSEDIEAQDKENQYIEIEDFNTIQPERMEEATTKYPNLTIKIDRDQYSIFEMKRRFDKERIQLDPDFQRNLVWNPRQKSELIESVIMGIPLPLIYLAENIDGKLIVVDGRQRLSTFFDYMEGKFSLTDLNIISGINKCKFKDLEVDFPQHHAAIEDFQLVVQIIKYPTPDRVRFDIFDRVNRGGTSLNNQEMRNALYQGNSTRLLKRLAENEWFQKATGYSINPKRMKDRYIILRALAFYLWREERLADTQGNRVSYRSDIEDFLGMGMLYLNNISDSETKELEQIFEQAMRNAYEAFEGEVFRIPSNTSQRRPVSMTLFESLFYLFSLFKENNFDVQMVCDGINELMEDGRYLDSLSYNVDSIRQVEERFCAVEELYKKVVG